MTNLSQKLNLIAKYNPKFSSVDFESVFSIGSPCADFAFNCDATGFQTLWDEYLENHNPLCTLTNLVEANGWEEYENAYGLSLDNLKMDEYVRIDGKIIKYPAHENPQKHFFDENGELQHFDILNSESEKEENKEIFNLLRQSPHRANLMRLRLEVDGRIPVSGDLKNIKSELDLVSGTLKTQYSIDESDFFVEVSLLKSSLKFKIKHNCEKLVRIEKTIPQSSHTIEASNYSQPLISKEHIIVNKETELDFDLASVRKNEKHSLKLETLKDRKHDQKMTWKNFWEKVELVDIEGVMKKHLSSANSNNSIFSNENVEELKRRQILSLYNLALHSSGSLPPQETGLQCNSWYGKFHLEMNLWHQAWSPLFSVKEMFENSLNWYLQTLPLACEDAKRNGFKGARWPKMVGPDSKNSPSFIAPILIWQQSHLIKLFSLCYGETLPDELAKIVEKTVEFMVDFVVLNEKIDEKSGQFEIVGPAMPAQEEFDPMEVKNPTFELAYWKHCLGIALNWQKTSKLNLPEKTQLVHDKIAIPQPVDGLYPSHENAPDTFPNFMKDHPMQLGILGMFENEDVDLDALKSTLKTVLEKWDEESMWGWDYGYMAMLACELDDIDNAFEILLKKCPKNYYNSVGQNYQLGRTDLPCYLPGNGALLWALKKIEETINNKKEKK